MNRPLFGLYRSQILMFFSMSLLFISCKAPGVVLDTNKTYTIDFNHIDQGLDTIPKFVKAGKIVTVNIINVNKDLFTVAITPGSISYNTTIPSTLSLTSIALPGGIMGTGRAFDRTQKLNPGPTNSCTQDSSDLAKQKSHLNDCITAFNNASAKINGIILFNNQLQTLQKTCGKDFNSDIQPAIDKLADAAIGSHNNVAADLPSQFSSAVQDARTQYSLIQETLTKIAYIVKNSHCTAKAEQGMIEDITDREKDVLSVVTDSYNKILTLEQNDQGTQIATLYQSFNIGNYTVSAIDTAEKTDKIFFNVSIVPKNWVPCTPINRNFSIQMKVVRWKVDFSTGVFANIGGKDFRGNSYFVDSNTKIASLKKNDVTVIPSIGALMHVYRQSGRAVDWGAEVGASITSELKYSNFHGGLCFMINTDNEIWNRIVFSAGFTLRYVNELSSNYHVGDAVDKNLTIDQLEVGKYRIGGYFGLTYNLTQH